MFYLYVCFTWVVHIGGEELSWLLGVFFFLVKIVKGKVSREGISIENCNRHLYSGLSRGWLDKFWGLS